MSEGAVAPEWAIVELMGHRRRAGVISEVERFGTKLLRIDIPLPKGEADGPGGGYVTEFAGGSSIYALRPCSEEVARAAARAIGDPRPVMPAAYRLTDDRDGEDLLGETFE